ncbi:MAG: MFS transporter [Isosphaeraceae bacterium]|nr:MFS transporter [Isosphaeraceae bacterium]
MSPRPVEVPSPPRTAAYKWGVVFMLWLVCFFNYADRQAIFAVFPRLKVEFGFSTVQLGLIGSAFMWVYALGSPVAGFVGDRLRRKDLVLGGCIFWSGVTVLTGRCTKLWHFVTVRALEGFGETFYFPASMSIISDYHGPRSRSRALAFHQSGVYAGTVVGSALGAWLAQRYGWRSGFYVFGSVGAVLALCLYASLREPQRGAAETVVKPTAPLRLTRADFAGILTPPVLLLMAVFVAANFVATIFLTWTPTFLVEKFHYSLAEAGLYGTAFIHLASAVAAPCGGWLADRARPRMPGARALVQALGLSAGSVAVVLVGTTRDPRTLMLVMTAFGFCKGLYDSNIFAALYDVVEPRARATAAGLMNTVGWGGGALGPFLVGWAAAHGRHSSEVHNMSEAIAWCGAVYLTGALLLVVAAALIARREVAGSA